MKFFKLQSLVRLFVVPLTLSLMVTACMKPSPRSADPNADYGDPTKPDANQPAATFYNEEVTGGAVVSKTMKGFSIADEKQFWFKTCVRDKRSKETIIGHKFDIIGASAPVVGKDGNGRSDEAGCVYWTEKIGFSGLSDGKYLQVRRTLAAGSKSAHTGARNLSICINPWETGSEVVRDCDRKPVPEDQILRRDEAEKYLKGQSKTGENIGGRFFWVDDLRMSSVHDPGAAEPGTIDFNVAFVPKVLRKDSHGNDEPLPLSNGSFKGQFWIIAKTGGEIYGKRCVILSKSGPLDDMKMVAGKFKKSMRMKLRYMNTMGQLELVATVEPKETTADIVPFNGVWLMGDHASLLGMKFGFEEEPTYKDLGKFNAKAYADSCLDTTDGILLDKTLSGKGVKTAAMPPQDTTPVKVTVPVKEMFEVLPGGEATETGLPDPRPRTVKLTAMVPKDLAPTSPEDLKAPNPNNQVPQDKCVDSTDIPRLFPKDPLATKLQPGTDFLSCSNDSLPSGITRVEPFEFTYVTVKPEPVKQETSTERTIVYTVTTKVTNPLAQGAPFRDIEFNVTTSDGTTRTIRTNLQGDLIFKDEIHHTYFMPERYMLKVVQISHASGFKKRMGIVFNPWDNNGFTFFRDLRAMTKQMIASVNLVERPKSQLLLTQFQWGTQGFRYEVDDFLNLHIYKQFNLTLNPRALRYSSLTEGRNKDEPLRAGIYLMKVALQKDYKRRGQEPHEYVNVVSKLVRVRNGVINEPVEIEFHDFAVLKLRSNLMIELATIDETKLTPEQKDKLGYVHGPLDQLIDHTSGLAARTFIGPVVAYSNGFSASMRPADDLAEGVCPTLDCDELKRLQIETSRNALAKRYEESRKLQDAQQLKQFNADVAAQEAQEKDLQRDAEAREKYVGSIKHLANKTVSDMVARMKYLETKERADLLASGRLARFLDELNLEYASVYNEAQIMSQDPAVARNNQVLIKGNGFNDLIFRMARLNPDSSVSNRSTTIAQSLSASSQMPMKQMFDQLTGRTPFTAETFKNVLFGPQLIPQDVAARLCIVMIEDIILQTTPQKRKAMGFFDGMGFQGRRRTLNDECIRYILRTGNGTAAGYEPPIVKERKLRVFRVIRTDDRLNGNLMSVSVNAGSGYGFGKSESISTSFSPTKVLEGLAKVAGYKPAELFLDTLGVSMSMSRSESHSLGADQGTGVGQNLAVETREMRVWFNEYERCTTLRLAQGFVEGMMSEFVKALPDTLTPKQKIDRIGRGIVVCEGTVKKNLEAFDERYYQISQMIGDEVMNDPTSIENHPYLRDTLRSRGDYYRLMNMIEARPREVSEIKGISIDLAKSPMSRLQRVFATKLPKYPGFFTVEPGVLKSERPKDAD